MFKRFNRLNKKILEELSEKGQGMIDYALILAVVAVISVALFMTSDGSGKRFGDSVNGIYQQSSDAVNEIKLPENN